MQILCATDFSEPAANAADVAAALAKAHGLPLRIIHCAPNWPFVVERILNDNLSNFWRQPLEAEAERLRSTGIEVNTALRHGEVSHELLAAAAEYPAKMIVMGSTGSGGAGHWLLGRIAERVAEGAPVPTLVVRQAAPVLSWLRGENALRVLCGVDFNLFSDAALTAVKDLSEIGKLEVEAVHIREETRSRFVDFVAPPPGLEDDHGASEVDVGRDVWDRASEVLGEPPVRVHVPCTSRHGDYEMVHLADEREAGLMVVGTHQRHGWERLATHSFSRGVVAHAATNVLCVPAASTPSAFRVPQLRRVLVATDLSSQSHEPLRYALSLLPAGGAIRLLHIITAPEPGTNPLVRSITSFGESMAAAKAGSEAQAVLNTVVAHLPRNHRLRLSAETAVHEDTAAGICAAAERFGADIICMGTRGHSRAGVAVLGSVMQSVTAKCHRPVLVVPPAVP